MQKRSGKLLIQCGYYYASNIRKKCHISELRTVHTYIYIVLAKKFVQVFPMMLWKNSSKLFGQPNIIIYTWALADL